MLRLKLLAVKAKWSVAQRNEAIDVQTKSRVKQLEKQLEEKALQLLKSTHDGLTLEFVRG